MGLLNALQPEHYPHRCLMCSAGWRFRPDRPHLGQAADRAAPSGLSGPALSPSWTTTWTTTPANRCRRVSWPVYITAAQSSFCRLAPSRIPARSSLSVLRSNRLSYSPRGRLRLHHDLRAFTARGRSRRARGARPSTDWPWPRAHRPATRGTRCPGRSRRSAHGSECRTAPTPSA